MDITALEGLLKEIQEKVATTAKIEDIQVGIVEDINGLKAAAKDAKELKEAFEKLEASVEKLPAEWREDVKKYVESLPDPTKENTQHPNVWRDISKMTKDDFELDGARPDVANAPEGTSYRKSFLSPAELKEKAAGDGIGNQSGVPGAPHQPGILWGAALPGDPWVAAGAEQIALSAPTFSTVALTGITFGNAVADAAAGKLTAQSFDTTVGASAETSQSAKTYVCRVIVSRNAEDDIAGTVQFIENRIRMAYGMTRGSVTSAAVRTGSLAGQQIVSSTSGKGLEKATAVDTALSLTAIGKVPNYWPAMPAWVLNPSDLIQLYSGIAASGGFALDPQTGLARLGMWPIHGDPQAAANGASALTSFFGSWAYALIQAQRGRLTIDRYMETVPGAISIYAAFRFSGVVVDNEAYSTLKNKP